MENNGITQSLLAASRCVDRNTERPTTIKPTPMNNTTLKATIQTSRKKNQKSSDSSHLEPRTPPKIKNPKPKSHPQIRTSIPTPSQYQKTSKEQTAQPQLPRWEKKVNSCRNPGGLLATRSFVGDRSKLVGVVVLLSFGYIYIFRFGSEKSDPDNLRQRRDSLDKEISRCANCAF